MNLAPFGVFVFCSVLFCSATGQNEEKKGHHHQHIHQKSHHHAKLHENKHLHHHVRGHHKNAKARDANFTCTTICEFELVTVAKWFNNTPELQLLFSIVPPSVKQLNATLGTINATTLNDTFNSTLPIVNSTLNNTFNLDLNALYNGTAEWPIVTYAAKLFGYFLSRPGGLAELFRTYPGFGKIWRIVLKAFLGGSGGTDVFVDNLKDLFGFNGTSAGNLFNFTYWEQIWSSSNLTKNVENAVEEGIGTFANLSKIVG